MDSYLSQGYLRIREYNKLYWISNSAFYFIIPNCYQLHHLHSHRLRNNVNFYAFLFLHFCEPTAGMYETVNNLEREPFAEAPKNTCMCCE